MVVVVWRDEEDHAASQLVGTIPGCRCLILSSQEDAGLVDLEASLVSETAVLIPLTQKTCTLLKCEEEDDEGDEASRLNRLNAMWYLLLQRTIASQKAILVDAEECHEYLSTRENPIASLLCLACLCSPRFTVEDLSTWDFSLPVAPEKNQLQTIPLHRTYDALQHALLNGVQCFHTSLDREIEEIREWMSDDEGESTKVLAIFAKAGTGKSVLAGRLALEGGLMSPLRLQMKDKASLRKSFGKKLVSTLRRSVSGKSTMVRRSFLVGAVHFFTPQENDAAICICSVANQLAQLIPALRSHMLQITESFDVKDCCFLFRRLLADPCTRIKPPGEKVVVIIDGIDCASQKAALLTVVKSLWRDEMPDWCRLIVLCREDDAVVKALQSHVNITHFEPQGFQSYLEFFPGGSHVVNVACSNELMRSHLFKRLQGRQHESRSMLDTFAEASALVNEFAARNFTVWPTSPLENLAFQQYVRENLESFLVQTLDDDYDAFQLLCSLCVDDVLRYKSRMDVLVTREMNEEQTCALFLDCFQREGFSRVDASWLNRTTSLLVKDSVGWFHFPCPAFVTFLQTPKLAGKLSETSKSAHARKPLYVQQYRGFSVWASCFLANWRRYSLAAAKLPVALFQSRRMEELCELLVDLPALEAIGEMMDDFLLDKIAQDLLLNHQQDQTLSSAVWQVLSILQLSSDAFAHPVAVSNSLRGERDSQQQHKHPLLAALKSKIAARALELGGKPPALVHSVLSRLPLEAYHRGYEILTEQRVLFFLAEGDVVVTAHFSEEIPGCFVIVKVWSTNSWTCTDTFTLKSRQQEFFPIDAALDGDFVVLLWVCTTDIYKKRYYLEQIHLESGEIQDGPCTKLPILGVRMNGGVLFAMMPPALFPDTTPGSGAITCYHIPSFQKMHDFVLPSSAPEICEMDVSARVVCGAASTCIVVWDRDSGAFLRSFQLPHKDLMGIVVQENTLLVLARQSRTLYTVLLYDLEEAETPKRSFSISLFSFAVRPFSTWHWSSSVRLSLAGNFVVITTPFCVKVIDWETAIVWAEVLYKTPQGINFGMQEFASSALVGDAILSHIRGGPLRMVSLPRSETFQPRAHTVGVSCLCSRNDLAFSGDASGRLLAWDISSATCVGEFCGHTTSIVSLGAHEDHLVSCSYQEEIRLWRIHNQTLQRVIASVRGMNLAALTVYASNVAFIAADSNQETCVLQVWEASNGEKLFESRDDIPTDFLFTTSLLAMNETLLCSFPSSQGIRLRNRSDWNIQGDIPMQAGATWARLFEEYLAVFNGLKSSLLLYSLRTREQIHAVEIFKSELLFTPSPPFVMERVSEDMFALHFLQKLSNSLSWSKCDFDLSSKESTWISTNLVFDGDIALALQDSENPTTVIAAGSTGRMLFFQGV